MIKFDVSLYEELELVVSFKGNPSSSKTEFGISRYCIFCMISFSVLPVRFQVRNFPGLAPGSGKNSGKTPGEFRAEPEGVQYLFFGPVSGPEISEFGTGQYKNCVTGRFHLTLYKGLLPQPFS